MSRDYREERRMQSHDMQESSLPVRVLLGVSGTVGAARLVLVQLQSLQRGRRQEGARRSRKVTTCLAALFTLLQ